MLEWNNRFKWMLVAVTVFGILTAALFPVSANELDRLRREQEELERRINQQQSELQQNERQQRQTSNEIYRLEIQIQQTRNEINQLNNQLLETEKQVEITEGELKDAEERLDERTDALSVRVKEIFINGQVNYIEVLLDSTDLNDFLTRFALLERLMEQDMTLLDEIEAERQLIAEKKAELEEQHAQIASIKADTERKEQQLVAKNRERQQWLASLESNAVVLAEALDDLEETSNRIEQEILNLQRASRGSGISGIANWPTPGYTRVTSDYGNRIHPILRTQRMHSGLDIAAPTGANIVAVEFGTVIYSDWFGGYGQTIIIDHGQGISSLYAHQSRLLVSVGEEVDRGQVIGRVGSTGQSTGPHLHFEIRKNGRHTNPWPYLR